MSRSNVKIFLFATNFFLNENKLRVSVTVNYCMISGVWQVRGNVYNGGAQQSDTAAKLSVRITKNWSTISKCLKQYTSRRISAITNSFIIKNYDKHKSARFKENKRCVNIALIKLQVVIFHKLDLPFEANRYYWFNITLNNTIIVLS